MDYNQISMDDIENEKLLGTMPGRTAYIDEFGSFGFDFSAEGTSKYYILCAVVVENENIDKVHSAVANTKSLYGIKDELKSSKIGNNYKWRTGVLAQFLPIDFRIVLFVVDKKEIYSDSPLRKNKEVFIKFLHKQLYKLLYRVYPKLKIIEDEVGTSEFQTSFRNYVRENRPQPNLLNEYAFDYTDSKDELLVQLADIIGGSIGHSLTDDSSPNYKEMLQGKIVAYDDFPHKNEPYWGTINPEDYKYNRDIFTIAVKSASDFIEQHGQDGTDESRAQVALLDYLLLQVRNVDPTRYISSNQLIGIIKEYNPDLKITKNYLYRRVIAPLRDRGVIIASCANGYKIPISVDDIKTYINQTHTVVSPMLNRVRICRDLILQSTSPNYDVLDDPAFVRYKKYFD